MILEKILEFSSAIFCNDHEFTPLGSNGTLSTFKKNTRVIQIKNAHSQKREVPTQIHASLIGCPNGTAIHFHYYLLQVYLKQRRNSQLFYTIKYFIPTIFFSAYFHFPLYLFISPAFQTIQVKILIEVSITILYHSTTFDSKIHSRHQRKHSMID